MKNGIRTMTLYNDFHTTSVVVRVPVDGFLSKRVSRRVEKALCGVEDCSCNLFSGPQGCKIVETSDHTYRIVFC